MRQKQILILLLIITPIIQATPILTLQHESIQPGETTLATITTTGEFTSQIEKSQIKFYEGRKQTYLESNIILHNQTHYLSIYTTKESNLTLEIENILYKESGILQSITISKNITIQPNEIFDPETNQTYTQIIKIRPGFITTSDTAKLTLTNTGTKELTLEIEDQELTLTPSQIEQIEFTPKTTFALTELSTYKDFQIPTLYLTSTPSSETDNETNQTTPSINETAPDTNQTNQTQTSSPSLTSDTASLSLELFTENETELTIQLTNTGEEKLQEITTTNNLTFIETSTESKINVNETQNLTLIINPKSPGYFEDEINISYLQGENIYTLQIPLSILVLEEDSFNQSFQVQEESCEEISGKVCKSGKEICNGTSTFTRKDGTPQYCCLATCVEKSTEEESSSAWIVGVAIIIALALIAYLFYSKQKDLKNPTPTDALKSTTEKFEKRMSRNPDRTSEGLAKY